jgi:hypothetical protein
MKIDKIIFEKGNIKISFNKLLTIYLTNQYCKIIINLIHQHEIYYIL